MSSYEQTYRRSLADRDAFWRERAALIDWQTPFSAVLDYSPAAVRALVRRRPHQSLPQRGRPSSRDARREQPALIFISTETGQRRTYTYASCTPRSIAAPRCCARWASAAAIAC